MARHTERFGFSRTRHEARATAARLVVWVASLLLAIPASAQQVYQLSEGYFARSLPFRTLPIVGVTQDNCDFLMRGGRLAMMSPGSPASLPQVQAAYFGCPSGMGAAITATAAGVGGAFTLPPNVVSRPAKGYLVTVPLLQTAYLLQFATDNTWLTPHATRGVGADALGAPASGGPGSVGPTMRLPAMCTEAACTNLAPFRRFEQNAYANQTGRVGADFTWCWNSPGCTNLTQATTSNPMLIRFNAGPNAFGGTISQLTRANVSGSLAIFLNGGVVLYRLDADAGGEVLGLGRGYADFLNEILPQTKAYGAFQFGMVYQPALGFSPTVITMVSGPFTPPFPLNLPLVDQQYAFPLTTGTVVLRVQTPQAPFGNVFQTLTAMGGDTVTSMGARNISLVTGSLSNLSLTKTNRITLGQLYLSLPEPGRVGGLVAGAVGLLGLVVWRARKLRA